MPKIAWFGHITSLLIDWMIKILIALKVLSSFKQIATDNIIQMRRSQSWFAAEASKKLLSEECTSDSDFDSSLLEWNDCQRPRRWSIIDVINYNLIH